MTNKIFTAQQIRECDAYTIRQEGIASVALMERAAYGCLVWIKEHFRTDRPFIVICGMGNNGGDGLALTRMLLQEGYQAKAAVLKIAAEFSHDASHNFKLLHQLSPENIEMLHEGQFLSNLAKDIVIVDAIFGTGLNRSLTGWAADFIDELNYLPNTKIAIDIPSGLPADNLPGGAPVIFKADYTLSFQFYKRTFLHKEAWQYTGEVAILDIGLSEKYIADTQSQYRIITEDVIRQIYRPRNRFAHKGDFGSAVLVGGSYGKIGAMVLSAKAALHAGAGLVYVNAPDFGYAILQSVVPEAMFVNAGDNSVSAILPYDEKYTYGIGPGMGTLEQSEIALFNFLEQAHTPVVLDADALNILAKDEEILQLIPPHSILTPHPKEFKRLFGKTVNSILQVEWARGKAMKHNIIIVLKGHHTAVLLPDGECWYNCTGNAGMATGGSGDVLTGIITALMAQQYTPSQAALLGVYLHGLSGDIAATHKSEEALVAGDIIDYLGSAFLAVAGD